MTYDAAAFARRGRVSQARWLAEAARPYAEAVPAIRPYVETIRRFGAGEFVPRDELVEASNRIVGICQEFCVWDRVDQVMAKRSSKRMANCALAAVHSRAGILHCLAARFKTRNSSFSTASSVGKWPRARTARRSFECSASMALVV